MRRRLLVASAFKSNNCNAPESKTCSETMLLDTRDFKPRIGYLVEAK